MNLFVVRHAIAVNRGTPGYEDDSQRPLTDEGRKKMKRIAKGIHKLDLEFDTLLSSPYVRARDTARILANEYKIKDKVSYSDNLIPPGNFNSLMEEIREKYNVNNLALVGHEPMLSNLISWLTTGDSDMNITLKKGGICHLTLNGLQQETSPHSTGCLHQHRWWNSHNWFCAIINCGGGQSHLIYIQVLFHPIAKDSSGKCPALAETAASPTTSIQFIH